eukprot:scaffold730_cov365-Pinguiococcus_pyrenoidosus.AAC.8
MPSALKRPFHSHSQQPVGSTTQTDSWRLLLTLPNFTCVSHRAHCASDSPPSTLCNALNTARPAGPAPMMHTSNASLCSGRWRLWALCGFGTAAFAPPPPPLSVFVTALAPSPPSSAPGATEHSLLEALDIPLARTSRVEASRLWAFGSLALFTASATTPGRRVDAANNGASTRRTLHGIPPLSNLTSDLLLFKDWREQLELRYGQDWSTCTVRAAPSNPESGFLAFFLRRGLDQCVSSSLA